MSPRGRREPCRNLNHPFLPGGTSPHERESLEAAASSHDLSVIVETANGVGAFIHTLWHTDRTPEVHPLAEDLLRSRRAASGFWLPPIASCPVTASRSRQADPAERLLPGRVQAAFANPSSRAVHPC